MLSFRLAPAAFAASALLAVAATPAKLAAAETYYRIPAADLLGADAVPQLDGRQYGWNNRERQLAFLPYATLSGPGSVFVQYKPIDEGFWGNPLPVRHTLALLVRLPEPGPIAGTLVIPQSDLSGMQPLKFKLADAAKYAVEPRAFHAARQQHYRRMLERGVAGAAWFRHQYREAALAQGLDPDQLDEVRVLDPWRRGRADTYELFSGGAAISENLQLDRELLLGPADDQPPVKLAGIRGITVKAIDWKDHLSGPAPQVDALARYVPHDQHLVLFPSFQAMLDVVDEVARFGMPLASVLEPRAEDTRIMQRYRDQLCLETTGWSRLLGGKLVTSVALTGSDPYLRTGSDMAVLFECADEVRATTLAGFIQAKQQSAIAGNPDVNPIAGEVDGLAYQGVRSPDRRFCSYLARWGNVVVVANSPAQLARLQQVQRQQTRSLAQLDEYQVFRQRYVPGAEGESAFLFLSDDTIRRWCSARWRIGNARRTKAAAVLADLEARYLDQRIRGALPTEPIEFSFPIPELGRMELTPAGVQSSTYGMLSHLTPIIELELEEVSRAEAEAYEQWRNGYESNWRQFFDPIGVRMAVTPEKLALDLTVMPLIGGSEYRQFIEIVGKAQIAAEAGDRHTGTLWHAAVALDLDPQRPFVQMANGFLSAQLNVDNPLSAFGSSVAVYADNDTLWARLAAATRDEQHQIMQTEGFRFPVAMQFEVRDPKKLAEIIDAVWRSMGEALTRTGKVHQGQAYTTVTTEAQEVLKLHYATPPGVLILAWDEGVMRRALERQAARAKGERPQTPPWLGQNLAFQADAQLLQLGENLWGNSANTAQLRSWGNLPILNEWKSRYADQDPVALHEKLWHVRLTCPGGGRYQWNEALQTMESTVYGSPAAPRGSERRLALPNIKHLNLGVTFEDDGLRGRAEILRQATE